MKLYADILDMSAGERGRELMRLRTLIRTHKVKRGNARCWHNDIMLYERALPDRSDGAGRMDLPFAVLISECKRYIRGQQCTEDRCKRGVRHVHTG